MRRTVLKTRITGVEDRGGRHITHVNHQIVCFDTANHRNIPYRSPIMRTPVGDEKTTTLELPASTVGLDAEPQIVLQLCQDDSVLYIKQLYISSFEGAVQRTKISDVYVSFQVMMEREEFDGPVDYITFPYYKTVFKNITLNDTLLFKHYVIELYTQKYSLRHALTNTYADHDQEVCLQLDEPISIQVVDSVVVKIQGAVLEFEDQTEYFTLFQAAIQKEDLLCYRSRVLQFEYPFPQLN